MVSEVTALPLATSANRFFISVPTRVSNWLSSGTAGSGAAVFARMSLSVFTSGVWNAGSE